MRKRQAAYTFFEALIVLVIVAILAVISIPSLRHISEKNNTMIIQSQLLKAIQLARHEAQLTHLPVGICQSRTLSVCDGEWSDGLLIFYDSNKNGLIENQQQIIAKMQINTNQGKLNWRAFPVYRNYLRFVANAWLENDNGTFWYCLTGNKLPNFAIMINKSGHAQVVYPNQKDFLENNYNRSLRC